MMDQICNDFDLFLRFPFPGYLKRGPLYAYVASSHMTMCEEAETEDKRLYISIC